MIRKTGLAQRSALDATTRAYIVHEQETAT